MHELEGTIYKIFDTEQVKDTFRKRACVVEIRSGKDGQYPELVKLDFVQDRCESLDDFTEGESVRVNFELKGREWNGKVFTNLQAYRIERSGRTASSPAPQRAAPEQAQAMTAAPQDEALPF